MTKKILRLLSFPLVPLAIPAWFFERIYRKLAKRFWEFGPYSGAFYLLLLVVVSIYLFLCQLVWLNIVSIYIFSSLELLALAGSLGIVVGNYNEYFSNLMKLAGRKRKVNFEGRMNKIEILYSILAFGFTSIYFGVLKNFIYRLDGSQYVGVQGKNNIEVLFDFVYSSFISMTTLGLVSITPDQVLSKSFYMIETSIALSYILIVFALLANQVISYRR